MLTSRSKSGRLVRTSTRPSRSAQDARVAASSLSASATPTRAAAASASALLGAWPKPMAIFASPPGGSVISPQKAATRRPSSGDGSVAGPGFDQGRRQDVASRPAEEPGANGLGHRIPQGRRREGEATLEIVVGVLEQERRADRLVTNLVHARVRAVLERKIEEGRNAQALRTRAAIAQGQEPHVAWIVGRDEDDMVDRQVAAGRDKRRDPRLIGRFIGRVLRLERREAHRARLALVEVAEVNDLPRLDDGHAVKTESGEAVLAGVAEGGENLAVVGDHRRHAEFVRHHMRPGARRAVGEVEPPAVGREARTAIAKCRAGEGSTARVS